jgi:hypothetical protein
MEGKRSWCTPLKGGKWYIDRCTPRSIEWHLSHLSSSVMTLSEIHVLTASLIGIFKFTLISVCGFPDILCVRVNGPGDWQHILGCSHYLWTWRCGNSVCVSETCASMDLWNGYKALAWPAWCSGNMFLLWTVGDVKRDQKRDHETKTRP